MASSGFVPHDIHDHVKLADLLVIFECYLKKSTTVKKHSPSHSLMMVWMPTSLVVLWMRGDPTYSHNRHVALVPVCTALSSNLLMVYHDGYS